MKYPHCTDSSLFAAEKVRLIAKVLDKSSPPIHPIAFKLATSLCLIGAPIILLPAFLTKLIWSKLENLIVFKC